MKINIGSEIGLVGKLYALEGEASEIVYNEARSPIDWEFKNEKILFEKNNKICWDGLQFLNSRGWDVPVVIAIGNGLTDGADAPANSDTKLKNELTNGRFEVRGDGKSRCINNQVVLSALWQRGQGYMGEITEWGIFANEKGYPLAGKDVGYMYSRLAQPFQRSSSNKDVQLLWIITAVS